MCGAVRRGCGARLRVELRGRGLELRWRRLEELRGLAIKRLELWGRLALQRLRLE